MEKGVVTNEMLKESGEHLMVKPEIKELKEEQRIKEEKAKLDANFTYRKLTFLGTHFVLNPPRIMEVLSSLYTHPLSPLT